MAAGKRPLGPGARQLQARTAPSRPRLAAHLLLSSVILLVGRQQLARASAHSDTSGLEWALATSSQQELAVAKRAAGQGAIISASGK